MIWPKGPCIGSLFIAGVMIDENMDDKLRAIGVKDSKLLSHKRRVELEKEIRKIAKDVMIIKVMPE